MKTTKAIITAFIVMSAAAAGFAQSNAAWLEDYEAIKKYMTEAYANIDHARTKIDFIELDRRTTEGLKNAKSANEAETYFAAFFAAFRDGHFRLQNPNAASTGKSEPLAIPKTAAPDEACRTLGYRLRLPRFSFPFTEIQGFRQVSGSGDSFPAGILPAGNKRIAVINVGIFSSDGYLANCVGAWEEFRRGIAESCDDECADKFRTFAEKRLTDRFISQVRALAKEKPDALMIDLATNGGGSNWAETIASVVSKKPVERPPVRFIRHPHWVKILESQLADVDSDLARKDLSKKQKSILSGARRKIIALIAEARTPCDLSGVWSATAKKPDCTRLSSVALPNGFAPDAPAELIKDFNSRESLRRTAPFEFEKGIYDGRLFVLVDSKTASAAEMFVSMLQKAKSATVIGGQTLGAGCGFVDGGTEYFLPVSKLRLRMPDCSRFRADGVNEVEGIVPDVRLFKPEDAAEVKMREVVRYFSSL